MKNIATVGVSARHVHVNQEALEILFGEGAELHPMKDLSQPGQFAAEERVEIVGPKSTMKARILGPTRPQTQVEISLSDSFALGVPGVVRNSGDIAGTPGIKLVGPKGELEIKEGVIVAARHIHMSTEEASAWGIKDKDIVKIRVPGVRATVLENVLARVGSTHKLDLHIDTDEANCCALKSGDEVEVIVDHE
ncbi:phosphate propanoyltransferase [Guggenheimella bovis]